MSDPDLSAPPRNPHWLLGEPDLLPPLAQPRRDEPRQDKGPTEEGAPTPTRARATSRMPPTTLSGYEQPLAARAALRAGAERTAAEQRVAASPSPESVWIKQSVEEQPRRVWPRRLAAVLSGLLALSAFALLALLWVEPPGSPVVSVSRPEPPVRASAPPSGIAAMPSPIVDGEEALFAAGNRDAYAWAVTAAPEMPLEEAERSNSRPSNAEDEPASPPVATAAASADTEPVAESPDTEPVSGMAQDDAPPVPSAAAGAHATEPSADLEPAPAPRIADAPPDQLPPSIADTEFASLGGDPPEDAPVAPVAEPSALAEVALAAPAIETVPVAGATAEAREPATVPPPQLAMSAIAPRTAVDRTPAKIRPGGSLPRAARATEGDAPPAVTRCRAIILKAQLGGETSHAEWFLLRSGCGAWR